MNSTELSSRSSSQLYAELYQELHGIAMRELQRMGGGRSISPTTLLHEAYLSFAHRDGLQFPDRPQFIAYACRVMRGVLIDRARARQTLKRGGSVEITALPTQIPEQVQDCQDLERLGAELETVDPKLAEIVDLKYFCGLTFLEIAALQGANEKTVRRAWAKARIVLYRALSEK
jgi:RNA polymerase sigma factor (TIGR02999 family)